MEFKNEFGTPLLIKMKKFSLLNNYFMVFDTQDYIFEKVLLQNGLSAKIITLSVSDENKYILIGYKIRKSKTDDFVKCVYQMPTYMHMHGYDDYVEFCKSFIDELNDINNEMSKK